MWNKRVAAPVTTQQRKVTTNTTPSKTQTKPASARAPSDLFETRGSRATSKNGDQFVQSTRTFQNVVTPTTTAATPTTAFTAKTFSAAEIQRTSNKFTATPEEQASAVVDQQFEAVLGRTPEGEGYWHELAAKWLGEGVSLEEIGQRVAEGLKASHEYAVQHPEEYLNRLYQANLGRNVDGAGLETFSKQMTELTAQGATFEQMEAAIVDQLKASPEYAALHPASVTATTTTTTGSDKELADKINKQLEGTGLAGKGETIVAAARKERVPPELLMSMLQKESSFLSPENNISVANKNPGNLRFAEWETEFGGKQGVEGFASFPTVDKGIEAMASLLGGSTYRKYVDARDWKGLVNTYCPGSDQPGGQAETDLYVKQMNEWTASWQEKLGIGDDWLNTPSVGVTTPTTPTAPTAGATPTATKDLQGITPSQAQATQFPDQWSLCGPIAATGVARALGKDMTIEQARKIGMDGGNYVYDQGMQGPESEVRMLADMGIKSHTESPVDWEAVKADIARGVPVIISTPKHYFVVEGYDPATGKFDFGNTALAMKASNGKTWFYPDEIASMGGGAPTAVRIDA